MQISMLRAKLHQARVTGLDADYIGSIAIDSALLEQAGIFVHERVLVVDIENGMRLETYVIPAQAGSGHVILNGAAARLAGVGDRLIVMAFAIVDFPPPNGWAPKVLVLDEHNEGKLLAAEGITAD